MICAAVFFLGAFFVGAFFVGALFVGAFFVGAFLGADFVHLVFSTALRGGALLLTSRDISEIRFDDVLRRLPPYSGQEVGSSASWMPTFRTRAVTSSQRRRISILRFWGTTEDGESLP